MPIACDKNAFQLIEYVDKTSGTLIILLFSLVFIGLIFGILLLMKNNVPMAVDWIILFICVGIGIYLLNKNELELQYGAYVIITGFCISFVFLLIASFINENIKSGDIRKCPYCANEIKLEAIICQFCGKDLPKVEIIESEKSNNEHIWTNKYDMEKYFIAIESTPIKYGASDITNTIKIIEKETKIKYVSENTSDWYCVELSDGIRGFCRASALKILE